MVIYFSYFEENEEWFLKALRSASFFLNDLVYSSEHFLDTAEASFQNTVKPGALVLRHPRQSPTAIPISTSGLRDSGTS